MGQILLSRICSFFPLSQAEPASLAHLLTPPSATVTLSGIESPQLDHVPLVLVLFQKGVGSIGFPPITFHESHISRRDFFSQVRYVIRCERYCIQRDLCLMDFRGAWFVSISTIPFDLPDRISVTPCIPFPNPPLLNTYQHASLSSSHPPYHPRLLSQPVPVRAHVSHKHPRRRDVCPPPPGWWWDRPGVFGCYTVLILFESLVASCFLLTVSLRPWQELGSILVKDSVLNLYSRVTSWLMDFATDRRLLLDIYARC